MLITFYIFSILVALVLLLWQASNLYSAVILGVPAITSPTRVFWADIGNKNQILLDLGCGAGSAVLAAAPYFKHVYGLEYSPFYFLLAKVRTLRRKNISILYGDITKVDWPKTDLIYCYLLPGMLVKLRTKLQASKAKVYSLTFPIKGWKANKVLNVENRKLYTYRVSGES